MKKTRNTRIVSVEVDPAIFANLPKGVKISVSHGFLRNQCPAFAALGYMKKEDIEAALAGIREEEKETKTAETAAGSEWQGKQSEPEQLKRSEIRAAAMAPEREETEGKTTFRLVEIKDEDESGN